MALDHVRHYFHYDAFLFDPMDFSKTTGAIYFTRWITHFCAPVFMFLSGTSSYFVGRRKSKKELSVFLLTRGLWLMVLELFIANLAWSFDLSYNVFLINVIWVFGISMIIMAGLVHLPFGVILGIGIFIVAGHHLFDGISVEGGGIGTLLWSLFHKPGLWTFSGKTVFVVYPLIPWVGVMALGYCMGRLYDRDFSESRRIKVLATIGLGCVFTFVVLRSGNFYGDPSHWSKQSSAFFSFLSFLNTSKYPPSLLFLLMTLGPALLFLSAADRVRGKVVEIISIYGQVPLFYYLLHILIIHAFATLAAALSPGFSASDMILRQSFLDTSHLNGFGFSLFTTYVIWIAIVALLFPLCKWYHGYKKRNKEKVVLSYL